MAIEPKNLAASVLVVGSINVDVMAQVERHPKPGETVSGKGGEMLPGGKGANQAVAAALSAAEVKMIGAVGSDQASQVALDSLTEAGVDLSAVQTVPGATGLALVVVTTDSENSIVVIPGANAEITPAVLTESAAEIREAKVLVAQGEIPAESIDLLAELAGGYFVHNPAPVMPLKNETFQASNPLVVNEHEAGLVLAQMHGSEPSSYAELAPSELVAQLLDSGIKSVVLTLGSKGSIIADGDVQTKISATKVDAVDTTGAGDAFIGALAAGLSRGESMVEAAKFATRFAGFAVTGKGAQPSYPRAGAVLPELLEN